MKTTLDISDDLLLRAKKAARQQGVTIRSLVETGLSLALQQPAKKCVVKPVTFRGKGRQPEFKNATWEKMRDSIYGFD